MKLLTVFSTAALAVLLGISAPVYAQDEHPQEEKRAQPDDKAERGQEKQQEKQEDKQVDKNADKDQDKQVEKNKADKQVEEKQTDKEKVSKSAEQEEKSAHPEERAESRGEVKPGGHIPDDRFRANFGREHTFHVGRPVIVAGTPRFQYGGYWFVIAQPWPVGWAYTDVVYVDYVGGGYYLLSPVHPGVQISINVIL